MENLTPKEKLSKVLSEKTVDSKNLKLMYSYFGKENIDNLPFKTLRIGGLYPSAWDGTHTLEVCFITGRVHQSCTVSDVGDILIKDTELKLIEKAIYTELEKY